MDERLLTVSGNVTSSNQINIETGATIALNGDPRTLPLTLQGNNSIYDYSFSTQVDLIPGPNSITVTAANISGQSGNDTVTVNANIQPYAIKAELTWDTNYTDLDSHLIAPGYAMRDSFGDCYFGNNNPDWNRSGGNDTGDPSLDVDNTWGYGPEYIVLQSPPFNGIYQYKVHYWSDNEHGNSTATVKIWIYGVKVFQGNKTMSNDDVWDCANIDWPSGNITTGPTLTVTSQGCCPILVSNLPQGNQTVPAGGNSTFSGIPEGTNVTLTAQSDDFCNFGNWTIDEGNSITDNPITVTMNNDHAVTATCTPLYNLYVEPVGCGNITVFILGSDPQTIEAGTNHTFTNIPCGTDITLTHQEDECCEFLNWSGDIDPNGVVHMDSNQSVSGNFETKGPYELYVEPVGCGNITVFILGSDPQTIEAGTNHTFYEIPCGTVVTLEAVDSVNCTFDHWVVYSTLGNYIYDKVIYVTMNSDHTAICYSASTPTPPAITTTSLPDGEMCVYYSQPLSASGGSGNYTWSISDGSLPGNVTLDPSTGAISGTPDTAGISSFTVQVSDGIGNATKGLSITINAELIVNPGFEDSFTGWSTSEGNATYSVDSTTSYSGNCSVKGVEINTGSLGRLYQDVTGITSPGNQYQISGWIKTSNVTGGVVIGLDYVASNGWTPADGYLQEIGYVNDTPDWTFFQSDVFSLPPMPSDAAALWFLFDFSGGNGTAWWDDVSLICVSCANVVPTYSLSVTSNGCCPITVELAEGNQTVAAGTTMMFTGISGGNVTLEAQGGGSCSFAQWAIDDEVLNSGSIIDVPMDSAHTADCVCSTPRIYVKWNAAGGNGTSWADAYTDLQSALSAAVTGDQIWVAAGVYKPTATGDRYQSFQMKNGVAIYGGFVGTETSRSQRNWATHITTLSGDIGILGNNTDNCYHVISNPSGLDNTAVLDGFTIIGGNANGSGNFVFGGGLFNNQSSPTITNCTFSGNSGTWGGGMYNYQSSSPTVTNCTFSGNSASSGGGMHNYMSFTIVTACTFTSNSATYGAGMYIYYDSPKITACLFTGNIASQDGGGMEIWQDAYPVITNCTFSGNSAGGYGGGIFNTMYSPSTITNCTFSGNNATYGGGQANAWSSPTITNCIFYSNNAKWGGGMYNYYNNNAGLSAVVTNCTFYHNTVTELGSGIYNLGAYYWYCSPTVTNCILWDNTPYEIYNDSYSSTQITYCDVQGGYDGTGNINYDPSLTPDFHLLTGSLCIDTGDNSAPSLPALDFEGDPRITDGDGNGTATVDMGADEYLNT